ncbi:hypothetical protein, partial [Mesorhizobium sp. WSM3868]|uniref:hypothetical protein n=1 Tax=Mesorhizobium sp. WSM3868 TaxID=2029405 RepID=UPI001AECE99F
QVIFKRRTVATEEVENAIVLTHGFNPFPFFLMAEDVFSQNSIVPSPFPRILVFDCIRLHS